MRIAIGSDHGGFTLKGSVIEHLAAAGHVVDDLGTHDADVSVDYPTYGIAVGEAVAAGRAELGVCICGTGIGISIAANKVSGIRAAVITDVTTGRLARQHNDANVVCLGARTVGPLTALEALDAFLGASFEGGRHIGRLGIISAFESTESRSDSPPASRS